MAEHQGWQETRWPVVWIAFGAGIVAATHIGKLPPALPLLRAELGAGLVMGGWIASMISCTGFALGLFAGSLADRFGQRRMLMFGLLALAAGSIAGACAQSGMAMLAARFVEGTGFTTATIAGAGLIVRATAPSDRRWALGIWSSYLPIGFAGMLIAGALVIDTAGWRTLWIVCAAISVAWAVAVWRVTAGWSAVPAGAAGPESLFRNVTRTLGCTGALLVATCFGLYAAQQLAITSWLPTYMYEVYGVGPLAAAAVPALILVFNAGGNWLSARFMGRGAPGWALLMIGSCGIAAAEIGLFSDALPDAARLGFALCFGVFGGLIPAAALASVSTYSPSPLLIGTMNGLLVMGTNTGQLFGPPALAAARESAGSWSGALWLVLCLAAAGAILALLSRSLERRATVL